LRLRGGRPGLRKLADLTIQHDAENQHPQRKQDPYSDHEPPGRGETGRWRDAYLDRRFPLSDHPRLPARALIEEFLGGKAEIDGVRAQEGSHVRGAGEVIEGFLLERLEIRAPDPGDAFDLVERQAERLPGIPQPIADPNRCHSPREFLHRGRHSCAPVPSRGMS
jgi:hypothetical protein